MSKRKPRRKAVSKAMGRKQSTARSWKTWGPLRFARFVDQRQLRQAYCHNKHLGCSSKPNGPCIEEVMAANPHLDETVVREQARAGLR